MSAPYDMDRDPAWLAHLDRVREDGAESRLCGRPSMTDAAILLRWLPDNDVPGDRAAVLSAWRTGRGPVEPGGKDMEDEERASLSDCIGIVVVVLGGVIGTALLVALGGAA